MRKMLAAALALAALSAPAAASRNDPVVDYPDQRFTTVSGAAPSPEKVRQAVGAAAAQVGWAVDDAGAYRATATYRHKSHVVAVVVSYPEPFTFAVTYLSSVNMNFEQNGAERRIHPKYNKWTKALVESIRTELSKL